MSLAAAAAVWLFPSMRFCLKSRTCASVTMGQVDTADELGPKRQI
jgi:hypothetical protein